MVAVMCLCLMFMYQEVGDLFNTIDMDRSGTIDFDEFLRHLRVTKMLNAKIGIMGLQHLVLDLLLNFKLVIYKHVFAKIFFASSKIN